ncbi:unnamed protein product, partial [Mesorhabditis belari]|uniref:Abnormal cell migration protein 18-like fibronectin type I domain-containing protein n=1 Tax=Mesorhabditis belari TaxID=2138241 RepID=A0AAF3EB87_9BILA
MFWLLLSLLPVFALGRAIEEGEVILTPHGMGMHAAERIVIPVTNGVLPPLPCVMRESGAHDHGSSFTKGNFHYLCNNGTAEVMACISEDGSVIQLGRTFVKNGIRHKCNVATDTVTYEQESMCYENGVHYNVGDSFRNGSFKLTCRDEGVAIEGCYLQNSVYDTLQVGESRIVGHYRHECEQIASGKVRYTVKVIGCVREDEVYNINQVFTDRHVRYQCMQDGTLQVLGCVDNGLFVELGRDLLLDGLLHRCYKVDRTTFYHKFPCDGPLAECIANSITPRVW